MTGFGCSGGIGGLSRVLPVVIVAGHGKEQDSEKADLNFTRTHSYQFWRLSYDDNYLSKRNRAT